MFGFFGCGKIMLVKVVVYYIIVVFIRVVGLEFV